MAGSQMIQGKSPVSVYSSGTWLSVLCDHKLSHAGMELETDNHTQSL